MEHVTFERPRERLRQMGAASLTTTELLQVLVASGTAKASSARVAKNIHTLFSATNKVPTFDALLRITGVGVAKSCQILAAIELGRRIAQPQADANTSTHASKVAFKRTLAMVGVFMDGSGKALGELHSTLETPSNVNQAVRHLFGEALAHRARSIEVSIGERNQDIHTPAPLTLDALQKVHETAALLQIALSAYLVNKTDTRRIKRGDIYG